MYITGTYDTRWNNDIFNPTFAKLTAGDFEVVQLGYNPPPIGQPSLNSLSVNPATVSGGQNAQGKISLSGAAPSTGATVTLSSANPAAKVPSSATVPPLAATVDFTLATSPVSSSTAGNVTASYAGATKFASLIVSAPAPEATALASVSLNPSVVIGGKSSFGTVTLTKAAPSGGVLIALKSNTPSRASVPVSVTIPAGASSDAGKHCLNHASC